MENEPTADDGKIDRWTMMRDIAVLQVKLVADGLRDFMLVPASLVVGIVSLFGGEDGRPSPHFYRLLRLGKRSESWINLFGAVEHAPKEASEVPTADDTSIDDLVARLEHFVVDEYRRGGVTSQAKRRIDDALDAIQRNTRKRSGQEDHEPPPGA